MSCGESGDEVFRSAWGAIGTALAGFALVMAAAIGYQCLTSDFDTAMRRRRMEKHITKVRGHYLLCGFGRVGRNVAQELEATNRHFIAIDESKETLETQADKRTGLLSLHGDASEDDMLIEANIAEPGCLRHYQRRSKARMLLSFLKIGILKFS